MDALSFSEALAPIYHTQNIVTALSLSRLCAYKLHSFIYYAVCLTTRPESLPKGLSTHSVTYCLFSQLLVSSGFLKDSQHLLTPPFASSRHFCPFFYLSFSNMFLERSYAKCDRSLVFLLFMVRRMYCTVTATN